MENSIGRLRLLLAAGIVVALLPLSVAEAKTDCQENLAQAQLRPFESQCKNNQGGQSHCSVNTSKVPNSYGCCCTYSLTPSDETGNTGRSKPVKKLGVHPSSPSDELKCPKGSVGTPPKCTPSIIFF